ncbi:MAG: pyruvate dehydrogenase (acetyl-transferring) E1 component subunit alpha [Phycisphaeraceae bacterium]|nr:pyruvate dehydrogenase (acetyl-transferring) E1 component subunit alpha [Phycisphaeraceae bacterium]
MTITSEPDTHTSGQPSDRLDAAALLSMLGEMLLIRRFEERCAQSYQQAKIGGFCHLYIGQEAVAVGSISALRDDDPIITAYRDHGHALARGMDPRLAMAEMFGKVTGCSKGKGGSMHLFDKEHHMYGGHAIVGGQCPLGVGIAFGIQYQQEDKVCVCYLGDGALNQGAFHEAMNLAAIWKLPILFVVENNQYSMGTHIARGTSMADDLSVKAGAYGMRYAECDGMGVLKVYDCFAKAAEQTRAGEGPCLINVETYRFKGHSMSDPQKYRTKEEVAEFEEHDCIQRLRRRLLDRHLATEEQILDLDEKAKKLALEAVKFAEESPATPVEEMFTDVYSQPFEPYRRGEAAEGFRE